MFSINALVYSVVHESLNLNDKLRGVTFELLDELSPILKIATLLFNNNDLFGKFLLNEFVKSFDVIFLIHNHVGKAFMVLVDVFLESIETVPVDADHAVFGLDLPANRHFI